MDAGFTNWLGQTRGLRVEDVAKTKDQYDHWYRLYMTETSTPQPDPGIGPMLAEFFSGAQPRQPAAPSSRQRLERWLSGQDGSQPAPTGPSVRQQVVNYLSGQDGSQPAPTGPSVGRQVVNYLSGQDGSQPASTGPSVRQQAVNYLSGQDGSQPAPTGPSVGRQVLNWLAGQPEVKPRTGSAGRKKAAKGDRK